MKKNIPFFRVLALQVICLLLSGTIVAQTTYVTTSGDDTKDGTSWGNAFRTLQQAIATVVSGDQIWVAAGTYYPDEGAGQTDNDPLSSSVLKGGVEIILSQREKIFSYNQSFPIINLLNKKIQGSSHLDHLILKNVNQR